MISETCSVCGGGFDVVFRYQMEEKNGGFAFYCSQKCLEKSQKGEDGAAVTCDACSKRFTPDLVSQVLYVGGKRKYACAMACRAQLVREAQGARLGEMDGAKRPSRSVMLPSVKATERPQAALDPAANGIESAASETTDSMVASIMNAGRAQVSPASIARPTSQRPAAPTSQRPAAPVSQRPAAPVSQKPAAPVSQRPAAPVSQRPVPPSPGRRKEEVASNPSKTAEKPPTRTSGLMTAIRQEGEDVLPANEQQPGTVIPVMPVLRGEKKPEETNFHAPKRIAIFNHKGGTGKTTTAVSVAAGLAAKGKRVLLVDTDAQGNVSVSLGAGSERSLYHVLVMGLRVSDTVKEVRPNLFLLPSNETLAAAELYLAGRQNRDRVLSDRLSAAAADYDYVVLDCSPSLSLMNQNALVFADSVLVPVACDYLSLVGVRQVLKTVKNVNSLLHHPVQIWGVLPTYFDSRAKICNEAIATLKDHFGDRCLPPIRAAIKVKEAPSVGQTIFEYAAGSHAAEDYGVIVERILGEVKTGSLPESVNETTERGADLATA